MDTQKIGRLLKHEKVQKVFALMKTKKFVVTSSIIVAAFAAGCFSTWLCMRPSGKTRGVAKHKPFEGPQVVRHKVMLKDLPRFKVRPGAAATDDKKNAPIASATGTVEGKK